MRVRELRKLLRRLPGDAEVCVVDRNDSEQQTIKIIAVGNVPQLASYVIFGESHGPE